MIDIDGSSFNSDPFNPGLNSRNRGSSLSRVRQWNGPVARRHGDIGMHLVRYGEHTGNCMCTERCCMDDSGCICVSCRGTGHVHCREVAVARVIAAERRERKKSAELAVHAQSEELRAELERSLGIASEVDV